MGKLIVNEFRKFKGSFIHTVAMVTMLFPVLFTALFYYFGDSLAFEWGAYLNSLHLFYGIFLGSLIPSFVAIFSVYTEFKNGTMKNMITSPHGRVKMITAKTLYVMLFVAGLYCMAGVLVFVSGLLIGLETSASDIWRVFKLVSVTGFTTIVLVPMMIYCTLLFRSFVAPVVIMFLGAVVGIPIINMGESYVYPWMIPTSFFFRLGNPAGADFSGPIAAFVALVCIFSVLSALRFRRMDLDT